MALRSEILTIKWAPAAAVILACGAVLSASLAGSQPAVSGPARPGVTLTPCHVEGVKEELHLGRGDGKREKEKAGAKS